MEDSRYCTMCARTVYLDATHCPVCSTVLVGTTLEELVEDAS